MKMRILLIVLLVAGLAFTSASVFSEPQYGGKLVMGINDEVTRMDPHLQGQRSGITMISRNIYSGLLAFNPSMEVVPDLATEWEFDEENIVWTFYLREGVKFHNGEPFTAEDVKFSFERIMDPDTGSPHARHFVAVKDIEVVDDYTVKIFMEEMDSSFLEALAYSQVVIVPQSVVEEEGNLNTVAIGTGPFKMDHRRPDVETVLVRNEDYFREGLPYLDQIQFRIMPDDTARSVSLRTGQVDVMDRIPFDMLPALEADPEVNVYGGPGLNMRVAVPNLNREPWDDPLVRQAFQIGIDKEAIVGFVIRGYGEPLINGPLPSILPGHLDDPVFEDLPDREKAKELLAEAGYPDGFSSKLLSFSEITILADTAIALREEAAKIGIDLELELMELGIVQSRRQERDFDLVITGFGADWTQSWLSGPYATGSTGNQNDFSDPEIDALLRDARMETDPEARDEIYRDIQRKLMELNPNFPLFSAYEFFALSSHVKGYEFKPSTELNFAEMWLDQ